MKNLIEQTLQWIKENPDPFCVSPEAYHFFEDAPAKPIPSQATSSFNISSPPSSLISSEDEIKKLLEKAAPHIKLKEKPTLVVLVFFSKEEELFYGKLKAAIEQHLFPACLVDAMQWKKARENFIPKWILATQEIPEEKQLSTIRLSAPAFYQNNPEAKKALWKMLCQTLTLPT